MFGVDAFISIAGLVVGILAVGALAVSALGPMEMEKAHRWKMAAMAGGVLVVIGAFAALA
jgi:hypothetical protein